MFPENSTISRLSKAGLTGKLSLQEAWARLYQSRALAAKSKADQYPDLGGDVEKMEQLNHAYRLLMKYIEEFRYTFDEEEISKQFPGADYAHRFKP